MELGCLRIGLYSPIKLPRGADRGQLERKQVREGSTWMGNRGANKALKGLNHGSGGHGKGRALGDALYQRSESTATRLKGRHQGAWARNWGTFRSEHRPLGGPQPGAGRAVGEGQRGAGG